MERRTIRRGTLTKLGPREPGTRRVNVVVETPAGSRCKFRFDESLGCFLLHKRLPVGFHFPYDFGFVPGTRAGDGDPVDVMLIADEPMPQGAVVTVRLLGVIEAKQTEKGKSIRNDRLIAVAETEKIHPPERSLANLPARVVDGIEQFFELYNRAEGRTFEPLRRAGPTVAERLLDQGIRGLRGRRGK